MPDQIIIGTRGSALALTQANWVKDRLEAEHDGLTVGLEIIKTKGDKILDVPLAKVGGKGLFVKEIEDALLDGRVDLAVHSMKDVPSVLPDGLFIACVPEREDCRDAIVSSSGKDLMDLPQGARVGTSSLRRQSQLLYKRPDLKIVTLRGNLDTRLRKLETEDYDAIVIAAAGLARMGLSDRATEFLEPDVMVPAIGQGALGLEVRESDTRLLGLIAFMHHEDTAVCVAAERAFLKTVEGGCQVPLAAHAVKDGGRLTLNALVADPDATRYIPGTGEGSTGDAEKIGEDLAKDILGRGGREILAELYEAESQ